MAIIASQLIISALFYNYPARKEAMLQFTKLNFVTLLIHITNKVSPTELIFTFNGDSSLLKDVVLKDKVSKKYSLHLDPHAIIIANHQIYSDWLFVWYLAYLNNCADQIFIVMKKSLQRIPAIGFGMRNFSFIFLTRNWAADRDYMWLQFNKICHLGSKCWVLIFPEGTNMSSGTIVTSNNFAKKIGSKPTKYVLLPRARGLYLSCKSLAKTTSTLYDLTLGYSGHTSEQMAQDIYSLRNIYLLGKAPQTVSIHISAYNLQNDIPRVDFTGTATSPLSTEQEEHEIEQFNDWLAKLWYKKDQWMKHYYETGKFPDTDGREYRVQLKLRNRLEIFNVYIIPALSVMFAYLIFSAVRLML
ncbi:hypothetical protein FOA43_003010 [Brettanomyces nanus]|uniref:Phospholipid/glycerol acyltransferase domain-containing protein n=1 Tax=Eeniella nana TaxID=13502 RepID=A0A875S426_EENNA|nr:uncharacterized protein FOA43_003010 [Brettanomyces nanus]QPG75653.1 hypothetical protein FOA43_003010 [Brettanomyces nanus]